MSGVRLGPRDMWALWWLSQMGGAPMDVVAELLAVWPKTRPIPARPGSSEANAYRVAQRWRDAGRINEENLRPVPGGYWVVPTKETAGGLLNIRVPEWMPSPMKAAHDIAVMRVRLHLAAGKTHDTWVSERELRHRNGYLTKPGEPMPHLHDGHWTDDLGRLHAVEVELTRKGSGDARTTLQAAYDTAEAAGAHQLFYFCASSEVKARVKAAWNDIKHTETGPELRFSSTAELILNPLATRDEQAAAGGAAS
ncbi:hypothetical protein [Nocardia tengchongensis]|uniref:hypothetical protein n=1 Tax=Nocardia tengchongensis TaxID=2055889 RepID=UPI003610AEAD